MTALVAHSPDFRLSWPRIGALTGTFSLHIGIVLLLLTPPVAMQVMRHAETDIQQVRIIEAKPPEVQIPDPPQPFRKIKQAPPAPREHHAETVAPPVDNAPPSNMSYESHDEAPPGPVQAPPAQDTAPTQLAYGGRTKVPYPNEAVRRGEHGTVTLRVLVGPDGAVQTVEIEKTSGSPRLDAAAREAVRHWTFRPGTRNGVAQSAWALVPIAFDLTQL